MNKTILLAVLSVIFVLPAHAEEPWTEIGGYVFASGIEGTSQIRNVTTNVDVSFGDVLENLDIGAMGFVEHRTGKWSFIGDVGYMKLSNENTFSSNGILSVTLNAELKQTTIQGLVGYRAFERSYEDGMFGLDILGGFRYISLEADIGVQAAAFGLTTAASRNRSEDWADAIIGVRAQYAGANGWGFTARGDIGSGSDSSSYQLVGQVDYDFKNNWKAFGGYQLLHIEYDKGVGASRFGVDLDYTGPRFGVSYRF